MRRNAVTKDEIIDAGLVIIENEGIEKCSVRRIAKELGIGVGTIYNYFDSVDGFILDVFSKGWQQTISKATDIAKKDDLAYMRLKQIIEMTIDDVISRNNLGSKLYEMSYGTSKPYFSKIHESYEEIFWRIFEDIQPMERRRVIVSWMKAILFDHIKYKTNFLDYEWKMIEEWFV